MKKNVQRFRSVSEKDEHLAHIIDNEYTHTHPNPDFYILCMLELGHYGKKQKKKLKITLPLFRVIYYTKYKIISRNDGEKDVPFDIFLWSSSSTQMDNIAKKLLFISIGRPTDHKYTIVQ